MTRRAVVSPVLHGDRWLWSWTLYDWRGYGVARNMGDVDTPIAAAENLAHALDASINHTRDRIYGLGRGVEISYTILCPFGAPKVCNALDGQVCEGCEDRAMVAAIAATSDE